MIFVQYSITDGLYKLTGDAGTKTATREVLSHYATDPDNCLGRCDDQGVEMLYRKLTALARFNATHRVNGSR